MGPPVRFLMGVWRTLDHTADVAIEVEGRPGDLGDLLDAATRALVSVALGGPPERVASGPVTLHEVAIGGLDPEAAFIEVLSTAHALLYVTSAIPLSVELPAAGHAWIRAMAVEPAILADALELEIKAVTWGDLHVDVIRGIARVTFDV